jgi:hypothetical protein
MTIKDVLLNPFAYGLYLGLIFAALTFYRVLHLKSEMKRYKRHLSDKLEIEADSMNKVKREVDALRKENENLRLKVGSLNELPDRKLQRDLEVYARAEKRMLISVPGFAPAWESAKNSAVSEIGDEEAGRSIPKRVFARLFGGPQKEGADKVLTDAQPTEHSAESP